MPKINHGKRFEEDIKNSVPDNWFCYRLKDSSGSWSNNDKSRFTPSNMCDFIIFTGRMLYSIECKSFLGKSMPYGNLNDKKGSKLDQLERAALKENCRSLFILNFRSLEKTFYIDAMFVGSRLRSGERKSLSLEEAEIYGALIPQKLKKVRYTYQLEGIL